MKKQSFFFSIQRCLYLADANWLKYNAIADNRFLYEFMPAKQWLKLPIVDGSLQVNNNPARDESKFFNIDIDFRVAFSEIDNQNEIEYLASVPLVAMYQSGGNQIKVSGSKESPLRMKITQASDFDGYNCNISGTSFYQDAFIVNSQ